MSGNIQTLASTQITAGGGNGLLTGLVSYYKLDEASGNATDQQGANTLTDTNSVGTGTGIINGARDFENASTQYLTKSTPTGVDLQTVSVSTWINAESFIDFGGIVANFPTGWGLYTMTSGGNRVIWIIQDNISVTAPSLSTATWYHIVAVKDDATDDVLIYVNGSLIDSDTSTDAMTYSSNSLRIGSMMFYGEFDGLIDETGIWSRALTADDVTALYNGGAALAYGSFT